MGKVASKTPLNVLAVTSWGTACGIANYAQMLQEGIEDAGLEVDLVPESRALDPQDYSILSLLHDDPNLHGAEFRPSVDVVWLNYHAGLHSRWTPEVVARVQAVRPVVVTYHDTYDGTLSPNSENAKAIAHIVSKFIVHEPVADIPGAIYLRQGVPRPQRPLELIQRADARDTELAHWGQPILGTVGFDFPWKNYTRLAQVTAEAGWAFMVLSNDMTEERENQLRAINPHLLCSREFLPTPRIVSMLASCDATAFMYECHNTGTSGAVRLGIAALKPVHLMRGCRQFRDLQGMDLTWHEGWPDLAEALKGSWPIERDFACNHIAVRDSWLSTAKRYAALFEIAAFERAGTK